MVGTAMCERKEAEKMTLRMYVQQDRAEPSQEVNRVRRSSSQAFLGHWRLLHMTGVTIEAFA